MYTCLRQFPSFQHIVVISLYPTDNCYIYITVCTHLVTLVSDIHGSVFHVSSSIIASSQSRVTIAEGIDGPPSGYIFFYGTGSESLQFNVTTNSAPWCTYSSCQHTFNNTSSQVEQYTVTVAARNVVGVGNASTPVTVGT